jgi:hypothetical protein
MVQAPPPARSDIRAHRTDVGAAAPARAPTARPAHPRPRARAMATAASSIPHTGVRRADVSRALVAGAVVGVLDGAFALVLCKTLNPTACSAERMFQGIAAGLLGKAAFSGGAATAALGVALHFAIATGWSAAFVAGPNSGVGSPAATARSRSAPRSASWCGRGCASSSSRSARRGPAAFSRG